MLKVRFLAFLIISIILFALDNSCLSQVESKYKNFSLNDFTGIRHNFSTIVESSKVTILSFWASWCEPCLRELVELDDIYLRFKAKGLSIVAVNIDSRHDLIKAKRFVLQNKLRYIFLYDEFGEVRKKYTVESLPQMFIFDKTGTLKFYHKGLADISVLINEIEQLIEK